MSKAVDYICELLTAHMLVFCYFLLDGVSSSSFLSLSHKQGVYFLGSLFNWLKFLSQSLTSKIAPH